MTGWLAQVLFAVSVVVWLVVRGKRQMKHFFYVDTYTYVYTVRICTQVRANIHTI